MTMERAFNVGSPRSEENLKRQFNYAARRNVSSSQSKTCWSNRERFHPSQCPPEPSAEVKRTNVLEQRSAP